MKKLFLLMAAVMMTVTMSADGFGILVNGSKYFAGELNTAQTEWTEYMITGVPLSAGDYCVIYDSGNNAGWVEPLDDASTPNLVLASDKYTVSADGCYDFYLKMFGYEDNQLYVGPGAEGCTDYSTEISAGGGQGGSQTGQLYYYLKESGMGSPSANELFENGILADYDLVATDATGKAYIFLIVSTTEGSAIGQQYMTKLYVDGGTSAQFFPDGVSQYEKWGLDPGTYTFYLYKDEDDSYTMSTEPIAGRTVVDAAVDAIDEVAVKVPAKKIVRDGQILIQVGDQVFNVLGAEVK